MLLFFEKKKKKYNINDRLLFLCYFKCYNYTNFVVNNYIFNQIYKLQNKIRLHSILSQNKFIFNINQLQ